jgi:hypothetical protein
MKFSRFLAAALLALASPLSIAQSGPDPFIVTSNADTDTIGTLRFAINFGNGPICDGTSPVITFAGPMVIKPLTPLPSIRCDTTIAGGGSPVSGTYNVQIDGSACVNPRGGGCDGFDVAFPFVTIQGLSIHSFAGTGVTAVDASLSGSLQFGLEGNTISGNNHGVFLKGTLLFSDASSDPAVRNNISGNLGSGIFIQDLAFLLLAGNVIDSNGGDGITIVGDNNDPLNGVSVELQGNFIRNNGGSGIASSMQEVTLTQNIISGNGGNALDYTADFSASPIGPAPTPPQIDSWTYDGTNLVVNVSGPLGPSSSDIVEIFSNPGFSITNLPMVQEGQEYVGAAFLDTPDVPAGRIRGQLTMTRTSNIAFPTATLTENCTCQTSEYSDSVLPPLAKVHADGSINVGGQTTVTVEVQNANLQSMDRIAFSYSLPSPNAFGSGSVIADSTCGTSVTPTANGFTVSNLTLAPGAICKVQVPVTSSVEGTHSTGNTSAITSSLGTGGTIESTPLLVFAPGITLMSGNGAFGNVPVGTSASVTFTFRSSGTATLSIGTVTVVDTTSPPTTQPIFTRSADTCSNRLFDPGVSCTVTVTFSPNSPSAFTGELRVPSNVNGGSTLTVALSGTGTAPRLVISPNPVPAFSTIVGLTTSTTVTLTNTGDAVMNLFQLVLVNSSGAAFSKSATTCASTLAPGASCTVTIAFAPTSPTNYSAHLDITGNFIGPTTVSIPLNGTGLTPPPAVQLNPTSLSFGSQNLGTSSVPRTVTLTNTGGSVLVFSSIVSSSAEFPLAPAAAGDCLGNSVPAGGSCAIRVSFAPSALGSRTATITITDNAFDSPQTVALSGTGAPALSPTLSLSASSLTFPLQPVGTSAAQNLVVTNTGTAALNIGSVTVSGADFTVSGCAGQSVAVGATCTIAATFTPSATGVRTGSISIASNDAASPAVVSLTGTGGTPGAQLSAASVAFPAQSVGTTSAARNVVLTNNGTTPLHIASIAITGDFGYTGCGFPLTLAPGASCTFAITFSPLVNGPANGSIAITTDAAGSPHMIALSGTGVNGPVSAIAVRPSALDLGDVRVGGQCVVTVTFTPSALGPQAGRLAIASNGDPAVFNVSLAGNGVPTPPAILTVETFLDFGQRVVGTSTRLPLQVRNTGEQALTVFGLEMAGAGFALEGGCTTIQPGESCTVTLVFAPITVGTFVGSLTISSNARAPVRVDLLGQGVAVPRAEIELSTDGIGFANQMITTQSGAQRIVVTSAGTAPLHIRGVATTGSPFELASNACPSTLAPGEQCVIQVAFLPIATGPAAGRVTVESDAEVGRGFASLTGTGCGFFSVPGQRNLQRICGP